jgi:hypothetical protein
MNKTTLPVITLVFIFLMFWILLVSCGTNPTTPDPSGGNTLDGQTLMQQRCALCHSLDRVISSHKTHDQWTVSVQRMIARGAPLDPQEAQVLIAYLAANFK